MAEAFFWSRLCSASLTLCAVVAAVNMAAATVADGLPAITVGS